MIHVPRGRVRHGAVPRHVRNPDLKVLGLSLSLSPPLYGLGGAGGLFTRGLQNRFLSSPLETIRAVAFIARTPGSPDTSRGGPGGPAGGAFTASRGRGVLKEVTDRTRGVCP